MDRLLFERSGPPAKIGVDDGLEFISRALDHWAYINRVALDFNETRPHTSLGFMTPADEAPNLSFWPVAGLGPGHDENLAGMEFSNLDLLPILG
ncbi:MAG: hypothetical protein DI547_14830 [Sphingobium sp.]|nr:MAG: hypothetical protein DI547_14830 [Sphingobium sp.]